VLLTTGALSVAAEAPIPPLAARVTDTTGTLSAQQVQVLDARLAQFEARKGAQIAVLLVPTTQSEAIEQYALRAVEKWKLGRKKVDDGVLLVIAKSDRVLRIEVGYGLEGALTDAASSRIINESIAPKFAQGDFAGGIDAGLDAVMKVIDGEPLPPSVNKAAAPDELPPYAAVLIALTLVIGTVLRLWLDRLPASLATGSVVGVAAWLLAGALSTAALAAALAAAFTLAGGVRLLGGRGHHHGGSGWGGGGRGGGGFRGGGGGFGGGGSGGRW
jgi:uncharacterized protein